MNTASNMIAKWYHSASGRWPKVEPKMLAMPTASEGAPPVRANSVCSPIGVREVAASAPPSPGSPSRKWSPRRGCGVGTDHAGAGC